MTYANNGAGGVGGLQGTIGTGAAGKGAAGGAGWSASFTTVNWANSTAYCPTCAPTPGRGGKVQVLVIMGMEDMAVAVAADLMPAAVAAVIMAAAAETERMPLDTVEVVAVLTGRLLFHHPPP